MGLVDVNQVTKEFGAVTLFSDVSFSVNFEDKLAIIGNNGVGKTTLLKMMLKQETIEKGSISIAPHTSIGYLSQVMIHSMEHTLYDEMLTAFAEVITLEKQLVIISEELAKNPLDDILLKRYGTVESRFLALDGYNYHYLMDTIITKFGFKKEDYERKIKTFSGGERNKIAFGKLLLNQPDVLILDEPTNHLDVSTIEWLEGYLHQYQGAILLVSHDRYFIDRVCNKVLEISQGRSELYSGNYSYYLDEKVRRYEQRLKAYELQKQEIEHLQELIKKFKPKPTKVAFAKDREKKLGRIMSNKIDQPKMGNRNIKWKINSTTDRPIKQFTIKALQFGYVVALTDPIDFTVSGGDKIGIIGNNGTGKTTLLKTIAGMIQPLEGSILMHRTLTIGYIDQNQIQIDSEATVFDYLHDDFPLLSNFDVRHHLGSFLFTEDDVFKRVNQLSGGEKVRLSFAKLILKKYDVLLLDEPTNHLDIDTRKVLESALRDYPGTIIFVSHDRYFIDELATRIISIEDRTISYFEGDYQQFILGKAPVSDSTAEVEEDRPKEEKKQGKEKSSFSAEQLEKQIKELEEKIDAIKEDMNLEENYTDYLKMKELEELLEVQLDLLSSTSDAYLKKLDS